MVAQLEDKKLYLNLSVIGGVDHGKTTLIPAIAAVLRRRFGVQTTFDKLGEASGEIVKGMTLQFPYTEYETATRRYTLTDMPGNYRDINLQMMISIIARTQIKALILVVDVTSELMSFDRELFLQARIMDIQHIIVFINKCDMVNGLEEIERVEAKVRDVLSQSDFPADNVSIIHGSALKALEGDTEWEEKILDLSNYLDSIPAPERAIDKPFLMAIKEVEVSSILDQGTVVKGTVERGSIATDEELEIVGIKGTIKTTCVKVEKLPNVIDENLAAENFRLVLRGVNGEDIKLGQVIAKPDTIKAHTKFKCKVYIYSKEEGGRHTPFFNGYRPEFYFRTADVESKDSKLPEGVEMVMPGDYSTLVVTLTYPIAMEKGLRFAIREGGRTVGFGVVSEIF